MSQCLACKEFSLNRALSFLETQDMEEKGMDLVRSENKSEKASELSVFQETGCLRDQSP